MNEGHVQMEIDEEEPEHEDQNQGEDDNEKNATIQLKDLRKADMIKFKRAGETEFSQGELTSRAGKVGGKHEHWWNIKDSQGHIQAEDTRAFKENGKFSKRVQGSRTLLGGGVGIGGQQ